MKKVKIWACSVCGRKNRWKWPKEEIVPGWIKLTMIHLALVLIITTAAVAQTTMANYPYRGDGSLAVSADDVSGLYAQSDIDSLKAVAQDIYQINRLPWEFISGDSATVIASGDTVHTTKGIYQTMVLMTLVHEWRAYRQACYDDSTSHIECSRSEYDALGNLIHCYGRRVEWDHAHPTLEGFMSWIEKELKQ